MLDWIRPLIARIADRYRRWKFRIRQRIQSSWRFPIKVIFLLLVVVTAALYVVTVNRAGLAEKMPDAFIIGSAANLDAFLITVWGSVVFFYLIGIASVVVGLHELRDDIIESRLLYLFSSDKLSRGAMEHNTAAVTKLSAFCTSSDTHFYIEDIEQTSGCFKIEVESNQVVQNSFHNHPHVDEDVHLEVFADPVNHADLIGEIKIIKLQKSLEFDPVYRLDQRISLTNEKPTFAKPIPMVIDANGNIQFSYLYWIWCSAKEGYNFTTTRYCENVRACLTNRTDRHIEVDFRVEGKKTWISTLSPSESCELQSGVTFTPTNPWKLFVRQVKAETGV